MTAHPTNVRVVHADGTSTPINEVKFVERQPREVGGEIFIVDVFEATTVLAWRDGDRVAFDWPEDSPGACAIRTHRIGVR